MTSPGIESVDEHHPFYHPDADRAPDVAPPGSVDPRALVRVEFSHR